MSQPTRKLLLETYLEIRGSLRRFLIANRLGHAVADDILQDIYLKISSLNDDTNIANPKAYLFRIANNLMIDRVKSNIRRGKREKDWSNNRHMFAGGEAVDTSLAADEKIEKKQDLKKLAEAVHHLPPRNKEIFILHKLQGLTHRQVAQKLGISHKTVEKHLSKAYSLLASYLRDDE